MKAILIFTTKQEITVKNKGGREIKAIVYIMTKDYMQNFNPPGRSYLTGILKGLQAESDSNRTNPESSKETACAGTDTEESAKEEKSRTGTMKIVKKLFQAVCLAALFLSAGFLIYHMVYLPMENKKLVAELKGNFPEPEAPGASGSEKKDQPAGRKCPVAAVDLVTLRKQYLDVQGWLTIPDTGIDYPVLQSEQENGEFYLKRNYKKEYDINGSLFLQADCKVSESRNLIIYGHNMNSGAMFGNLDFYADETYYQEHPFCLSSDRG